MRLTALFITGVLLVTGTACSRSTNAETRRPPQGVQVARAVQRDIPIYTDWIGTVDGFVNADIKAQVTGYLGRADTFLELFCSQVPQTVISVRQKIADLSLEAAYDVLPHVDFSRDVLTNEARRLRVLRDQTAGWVDLGSPARVLATLMQSSMSSAHFRPKNMPGDETLAIWKGCPESDTDTWKP